MRKHTLFRRVLAMAMSVSLLLIGYGKTARAEDLIGPLTVSETSSSAIGGAYATAYLYRDKTTVSGRVDHYVNSYKSISIQGVYEKPDGSYDSVYANGNNGGYNSASASSQLPSTGRSFMSAYGTGYVYYQGQEWTTHSLFIDF